MKPASALSRHWRNAATNLHCPDALGFQRRSAEDLNADGADEPQINADQTESDLRKSLFLRHLSACSMAFKGLVRTTNRRRAALLFSQRRMGLVIRVKAAKTDSGRGVDKNSLKTLGESVSEYPSSRRYDGGGESGEPSSNRFNCALWRVIAGSNSMHF